MNEEWSAADEALLRMTMAGIDETSVTCSEFVGMIKAIRMEWGLPA